MSRVLLLASLLSCVAPALDASAQGAAERGGVELDVHVLEVDTGAMQTLDPKPALDAVVRRRGKGERTIRVARYRSLGLRLALVHQRPGVRVVEAPRVHAIEGMPRSPTPSAWLGAEETPAFTVHSRTTDDGRVALTIRLASQHSEVQVVVDEGETVMVSGLDVPPAEWPTEAPRLGDAPPLRTRLLFVSARLTGS